MAEMFLISSICRTDSQVADDLEGMKKFGKDQNGELRLHSPLRMNSIWIF